MTKTVFLPCLCLLLVFLGTACHFSPQFLAVPVVLPKFPEVWQTALAWELRWIDSAGNGGLLCLPAGSLVNLPITRRHEALVELRALFPLSVPGSFFRTQPYGALYPMQLTRSGQLEPNSLGGWCASLARPLFEQAWVLSNFNWKRLQSELEDRMLDPWLLEPSSLGPMLAEGRFRADYLKPAGKEKLVSSVWQDWSSEQIDPAAQLVPASVAGPAVTWLQLMDGINLPPGRYRWFAGGRELALDLSATGEALWSLSPAAP